MNSGGYHRLPLRTAYDRQPTIRERLQSHLRSLPNRAQQRFSEAYRSTIWYISIFLERPAETTRLSSAWLARHLFTLSTGLILVWLVVLYQGEVGVFENSIANCDWGYWEAWPEHAAPHHLIFVADPQLVDPHTYPGRPWPLSSLTIQHTDLYLKRSYSRVQRDLQPHTVFFLGDLFDGGREWSTYWSQSPDDRWHGYDEAFWQKEFSRFGRIFFKDWTDDKETPAAVEGLDRGPRVIASLPGNHDLGFGTNIQDPVRDRFKAYFGESNRIDIIGNHTFVSVDSVSLSARDEPAQDGLIRVIWEPAESFVRGAKEQIHETIGRHFLHLDDKREKARPRPHTVVESENDREAQSRSRVQVQEASADYPTILLTHVPLYRDPGTPCGPLRERWPPSTPPPGQDYPLDPDGRNALPSEGHGWQYQNVLSQQTTRFILESLGGTISRAFSGDDHDYCEVVHRAYPNPGAGVREITVKSMSWAMGVRRPGFVLASLWNEVDEQGRWVGGQGDTDRETIQTHLCLLPDQLAIFIRYGLLFGVTVLALLVRAVDLVLLTKHSRRNGGAGEGGEGDKPLLPVFTGSKDKGEKGEANGQAGYGKGSSSSTSSGGSDDSLNPSLSARNASATRPRSVSPLPSYGYGVGIGTGPVSVSVQTATPQARKGQGWNEAKRDEDDREGFKFRRTRPQQTKSKAQLVLWEWVGGVWAVGRVAMVWYIWLLYR